MLYLIKYVCSFLFRSLLNGEFCVAIGPATRTADIVSEVSYRRWLLIWAGQSADMRCMLAELGLALADSKPHKGD